MKRHSIKVKVSPCVGQLLLYCVLPFRPSIWFTCIYSGRFSMCDSVSAGKQHSSDFSRLIAQVRGRLGSSRQRGDAPGGSERREAVQESHSSGRFSHKSSLLLTSWSPLKIRQQAFVKSISNRFKKKQKDRTQWNRLSFANRPPLVEAFKDEILTKAHQRQENHRAYIRLTDWTGCERWGITRFKSVSFPPGSS